jgi:hypothetical protein
VLREKRIKKAFSLKSTTLGKGLVPGDLFYFLPPTGTCQPDCNPKAVDWSVEISCPAPFFPFFFFPYFIPR